MIFDWSTTAALASVQDVQPESPLTLAGEGLWVCLVSSGKCTASLPAAGPSPAGSALVLPPQSVSAGHLILSRAPLALAPEGGCHLLCIQLTGQAAAQFLAGLTELPFLARGETNINSTFLSYSYSSRMFIPEASGRFTRLRIKLMYFNASALLPNSI